MRSLLFVLLFFPSASSFLTPSTPLRTQVLLRNSPISEEEAQKLKEQAEKLRQEISAFQQEKVDAEEEIKSEQRKVVEEKKETRKRYSAEVPILKGDGAEVVEQIDFPPRISGGKSFITSVSAELPLGIILGESEDMPGLTTVDEVLEDGNGALAGVEVGDILRACTACQAMMKAPTWQIIAGGIGQPETRRFMYGVDERPFEEVMEAIGSNRMDPAQRPVVLVLEKVEK